MRGGGTPASAPDPLVRFFLRPSKRRGVRRDIGVKTEGNVEMATKPDPVSNRHLFAASQDPTLQGRVERTSTAPR
jgi:hypothetical protein